MDLIDADDRNIDPLHHISTTAVEDELFVLPDRPRVYANQSAKAAAQQHQSAQNSSLKRHHDAHSVKIVNLTIYESRTKFFIVGSNQDSSCYRLLKVDRTVEPSELALIDDEVIYSQLQIDQLIDTVKDGNKATGGVSKLGTVCCILGFIRFTAGYYMIIVTKRTAVALLGGHYIYHIDSTKILPISPEVLQRKYEKNKDEARYLSTFQILDLNKNFYFSYSYDITHTLQVNLLYAQANGKLKAEAHQYNNMFVWNHFLRQNAFRSLKENSGWCTPVIHGFIDQANISLYGQSIYLTLIARRSRYFAGARYLKRGANDEVCSIDSLTRTKILGLRCKRGRNRANCVCISHYIISLTRFS